MNASDPVQAKIPMGSWTLILAKKLGRALELGCGDGDIAAALAEVGFQVLAVDMEKGGSFPNLPNLTLHVQDVAEFEFPANLYDVIIARHILQFFPLSVRRRILRDIGRSLKRGGILFAESFLVSDQFHEKAVIEGWPLLEERSYQLDEAKCMSFFNTGELLEDCTANGLESFEYREFQVTEENRAGKMHRFSLAQITAVKTS